MHSHQYLCRQRNHCGHPLHPWEVAVSQWSVCQSQESGVVYRSAGSTTSGPERGPSILRPNQVLLRQDDMHFEDRSAERERLGGLQVHLQTKQQKGSGCLTRSFLVSHRWQFLILQKHFMPSVRPDHTVHDPSLLHFLQVQMYRCR